MAVQRLRGIAQQGRAPTKIENIVVTSRGIYGVDGIQQAIIFLQIQNEFVYLQCEIDTMIVSKNIINACNKALPFVHFYYGSRVGLAN